MYYKKFMFMLYSEIEVGYSVKKKIGQHSMIPSTSCLNIEHVSQKTKIHQNQS